MSAGLSAAANPSHRYAMNPTRTFVLASLMVTLCACSPTSRREIALPLQQDGPDREELHALATGALTLVDGCLRLDGQRLILWPPGTTLDQSGATPRIVDRATGLGVSVGDTIVIGGGEVDQLEPHSNIDVPGRCAGPYWLAAHGFFSAAEADWTETRATGPFSVRLPADLQRVPTQGIDTLVDVYERPSLRLIFDYGGMACRAVEPNAFSAYIDQRPVRFMREAGEAPRPIQLVAVFAGVDQPRGRPLPENYAACLTVTAQCGSERDCDVARGAIDSIRFD